MPRPTYPKDRFDQLPPSSGRVGAHRAENPHMRGWVVLLWAAVATVVLVAVGIFGTLVFTGRVTLFPTAEPTVAPAPVVTPVLDTTYDVLVLNATPEAGLASRTRDEIIAAGWPADLVLAGDAGSEDFATTTVYYPFPADEAAALALAEVIGGADVAQSVVYQPLDNAEARQLAVVLGLDRTAAGTPTPAS
ncbi:MULTISPECIES: LytR C-terminal domain-containing protein [unclassified Microbacterium]|uniref:LytR C-terminal domain-containing protein n=1 Tax=unclassified Microbacterium TaxID=2609290 RepID=UPI00214ABD8C|nr:MULTISPECIES: LytR C-terminal domain-containing protein [unclassified Microbacterium]MCR2784089.1 LytR C-terminal domain-containing protein [Microbacterium sp. zg.B96]MDL5350993.1 LytR C-terminal domain-containing protein [Microbacterium sp. zg-YB36]WIM15073.1 LytR C-terminal domain-containing protein [Microbacterium sp. zg-B96]